MASLSAQLREAGDHGRLPFHPACPVCCEERLTGALPVDSLGRHRAQALLAASVLVFSAAAPASVLGAEGDQDLIGTADPATADAPDVDPDAGPDGDDD